MIKVNYQKKLDEITEIIKNTGAKPKLLLQSCCAPCSSYVLEYLAEYFDITVFYYNPNIAPEEEFTKRVCEQERFLKEFFPENSRPGMIVPQYDSTEFYDAVSGLEKEPEGGLRCRVCFKLRLEKTAEEAKKGGYDYFCTTLTVSPHKNAAVINEVGEEISAKYGVKWLPSDFKKREGYKRSTKLSEEYGLYRQDYCGCEFSKR